MKVLITTHAQMFRTPDGSVWTSSVYGYDFFKRYLSVFEEIRLVTRMKEIRYDEVGSKIRVDGRGVEFYPLPFYHGPWQYFIKFFKIQFNLAKAISECDCAILRIPDQLSFQLFKKIRRAGKPCAVEVVAHSRDLFAPGTINTILRPFLRILWDFLQKNTCKNADGVAYVTEKYIQQRYPAKIRNSAKRFETFYTSADLDDKFFYKPRTYDKKKKEIMTIVHVSGINNTSKGHYELLNAVSDLNEQGIFIKVVFVGGGTLMNYYKNLSEEIGISNNVTFVGHVGRVEDIINILIKSDIFVFPTMTEGLPRVILEAMATGLPCIATDVGGISELLSKRCLLETNNVKLLKEKIIQFIEDKELLQEESYRNFEKAKQYSHETVQEKRNKFYYKLRERVK